MIEKITAYFPEEETVPLQHRLAGFIRQDFYLVGGELRRWDGPLQQVLSPVLARRDAALLPRAIGESPLLTEEAALETLEVAVQAYANGRGTW